MRDLLLANVYQRTKFETCTVVKIADVDNVVTLKSGLGVTQDHWKWHHLTDRMRLPIGVLSLLWRYFVSFRR